jgi:N-carbamoyl-L-amino-acid hydrolase
MRPTGLEALRVDGALKQVVEFLACRFSADCVALVRSAAGNSGLSHRDIVSGARHATYIARVAPTAMVFVPCKDGSSHNEPKDAKPQDFEAGCNVLLRAVLTRAADAA